MGGTIVEPENEFSAYGVRQTRTGNLLKAGDVPGEGQWVGALVKTSPSGTCLREPDFSAIRPLRRVFLPGERRGEVKGKDFIPAADWALSIDFDRNIYPEVALDEHSALKFLHRDTLVLPDAPMGYNVVTYCGVPLGFVKNLGKRCNNLHPQGRRILMDVNNLK